MTSDGTEQLQQEPQSPMEGETTAESEITSTDSYNPQPQWWETNSLLPFHPCSSMCIAGCTGSGKTHWVLRLLKHLPGMYQDSPPQSVMYCYGVYQPLFDDMEKEVPNLTFHQGLPTRENIEDFTQDGQHHLLILDDLMSEVAASKTVQDLFCQFCHHRNVSVIYITQNIFQQGKCARSIALNTYYLVLMRALRAASQISHLGRQLYPGNGSMLEEVYRDCTQEPYSYLVIDLAPQSEDKYRQHTHIFPDKDPIVYVPK